MAFNVCMANASLGAHRLSSGRLTGALPEFPHSERRERDERLKGPPESPGTQRRHSQHFPQQLYSIIHPTHRMGWRTAVRYRKSYRHW